MQLRRPSVRQLAIAFAAASAPVAVLWAAPAPKPTVVPAAAKTSKVVASAAATPSPKMDSAGLEFFERKIRPVLAQNCYQCHSATSEKLKGGLFVDSRAGLLKGGESGPAVIPGNADKSALVKAIRATDPDAQMPPKQKLTEQQVADLTRWVQMGAPWPAEKKPTAGVASDQPTLTQEQKYAKLKREHWAWQPVKTVQPPAVADASWPATDIDKFVLAKLEKADLKPVADADRVSLIRRVTFDLTGLPPTPEEIVAFAGDKSPDAYAKLVDRLLASGAFGETWGRHWLDVARYAESTGSSRNFPYHDAWRYRDYVIDSFNADKPYNTFVMEQVAGDLMPAKDAVQKNERLVATGLLAMGVKDLNERDRDKYTMDNVDEQIDVVSRSMLATTISCARCHDHKFDPIPTEEYYKVAGIFKSTEILAGVKGKRGAMGRDYADPEALVKLAAVPVKSTAAGSGAGKPAAGAPTKAEQIKQLQAEIQETQGELRKSAFVLGLRPGDREGVKKVLQENPGKAREFIALRQEMQDLRGRLDELESDKPTSEAKVAAPAAMTALGVRDVSRPSDCRVNLHGDSDNLGTAVARGPISLIRVPGVPAVKPSESGRLEFAAWLASPENPLTARVMANRVWHHLFGDGLVRTVDNFGTTGEAPSHPELLDYLAKQFVKDGWSVKKLVRQVVLSRTYRLGAAYAEASYDKDPDNVLLWRHEQRRLTAEQIRDALLAVGGTLDGSRPNGSPVAKMPDAEIREGRKGRGFDRDGGNHRSVYLPVARSLVNPMMDTFDFAEPTMVIGDRDVTTVATQALFLMNNEFAAGQSRRLAEKLLADTSIGNDAARLDHAYGRVLGRSATAAEKDRALAYLEAFAADAGGSTGSAGSGGGKAGSGGAARAKVDAWASFVQALVASAEFRYLN